RELKHRLDHVADVARRNPHRHRTQEDVLRDRGFGAESQADAQQRLATSGDLHGPARGLECTCQYTQQCALPRTVPSDQSDTFALMDTEADAIEQRGKT